MKVRIFYFSGTGCTRHVARIIAGEFEGRGHEVRIQALGRPIKEDDSCDLLVICFVVHACNAPEPVMQWAKALEDGNGKPVLVVSVSGGGEVTPNLACRVPLKRVLRKKDYDVVYEKMLVMPSNWITETKPVLAAMLLAVLPGKVSFMVNDVLLGKRRKTGAFVGNRLLTLLGSLEKDGAHVFGKNITVSDACTRCGLCIRDCPVQNISMQDGRIAFGECCIMCLNCIYSCPVKALSPGFSRFVVIKGGFNLEKLQQLPLPPDTVDIRSEARGFLWLGVKRYLLNGDDISGPTGAAFTK